MDVAQAARSVAVDSKRSGVCSDCQFSRDMRFSLMFSSAAEAAGTTFAAFELFDDVKADLQHRNNHQLR